MGFLRELRCDLRPTLSRPAFWLIPLVLLGLGTIKQQSALTVRRSLGIGCVSLPADFRVEKEGHVDWVSGQIRAPGDQFIIGFAAGYTLQLAVTPAKRKMFRWFKTESLGDSTLYYALGRVDGKEVLEATGGHGNFVTGSAGRERLDLADSRVALRLAETSVLDSMLVLLEYERAA